MAPHEPTFLLGVSMPPPPPPPIDRSSCLTSGGSAPSASPWDLELGVQGDDLRGLAGPSCPACQPGVPAWGASLGSPGSQRTFLGLPQRLQGPMILTRFCSAPFGLSSRHRSEASKPPEGQGSSMAYSLLNPELDPCLPGPLP